MKLCPYCSEELRDQASFCTHCGKKVVRDLPEPPPPPPSTFTEQGPPHSSQQENISLIEGGQEPAPSTSKEDLRQIVGRQAVIEQRAFIATQLLDLVYFAAPQHRAANKALLEKNMSQPPPIEDSCWGQVAFIAGLYARRATKGELTAEQRRGLWQALIWAVQYENYFRSNVFADRFSRLAEFLSACAQDADFYRLAIADIEKNLPELDKANLKKVREDLAGLPATPVITNLKQMMDKYVEPTEQVDLEPALSAIEHLRHLLDSSKEKDNKEFIARARQEGATPQVLQRLLTLTLFICQRALYRSETNLPAEDLPPAIVLTGFVAKHSAGKNAADVQKYHFLLTALQDIRSRHLEPASFVQRLKDKFNGSKQNGSLTSLWSDWVAIVTRYLAEQRNAQILLPELAKQWEQVFMSVDGLSDTILTSFLSEIKKHVDQGEDEEKPLDFLDKNQQTKLLESMRNLRLEQMRMILRNARQPLLSKLSKVLARRAFDEIQPPRSPLQWRSNNGDDLFFTARMLIMSSDKNAQKNALSLFEQLARGKKENAPLVREWLLFAQARADSLHKAVQSWREDYNTGAASWEEIWNLAVACVRMNDTAQALEVLKRRIKEQTTPFSHLRFALKCGVDILRDAENHSKSTVNMAVAFLLDHLAKLPLAQCYFAWLLLTSEAQEPIANNKQVYNLNILQGILERPVEILQPRNQTEEVTIADFEKDFEALFAIIQRLEENYILEPQEDRIGIKSKILATFLRTPQMVPLRVGIFVDYENLLPLLPSEMKTRSKEIGGILVQHAAKYGDVVCRWICASPANVRIAGGNSEGFEEAGFRLRYPQGITGLLFPTKKLSDFVLVECITAETANSKPDVYIIVSGDGDYFEKIMTLLQQKSTVRLIASETNLNDRYRRLAQRSQQSLLPEDYGHFFIDSLDEILKTRLLSRA